MDWKLYRIEGKEMGKGEEEEGNVSNLPQISIVTSIASSNQMCACDKSIPVLALGEIEAFDLLSEVIPKLLDTEACKLFFGAQAIDLHVENLGRSR